MKQVVVPEGFEATAEALAMSPAVISKGHVFCTGVTGSGPDGTMPEGAEAQARAVFAKLAGVLAAAEAPGGLDAIVEMTSYHVGLRGHFEMFDAVRREMFAAPYPAWTAVEVAGLRREGAVVEVRVVAALGDVP